MNRIKSAMLEIAKIVHEAIGIQSPRVFIAVFALFGFLVFGGVGWLIDKGYRVKLQETTPSIPTTNPTVSQPVQSPSPMKPGPTQTKTKSSLDQKREIKPKAPAQKPLVKIDQHSEGTNRPNIVGDIVKIDGSFHGGRRGYDTVRTKRLNKSGWIVFRFTNAEVEQNAELVVGKIIEYSRSITPRPKIKTKRIAFPVKALKVEGKWDGKYPNGMAG